MVEFSSLLSLLTRFSLLSGVEGSLKVVVVAAVFISNDVHVFGVADSDLLLLLLLACTHHFHLLDHRRRHVNVTAVKNTLLSYERRSLQIAFTCDRALNILKGDITSSSHVLLLLLLLYLLHHEVFLLCNLIGISSILLK